MGLEEAIPVDGYMTTQLSRVINWARRSSVWPMPFATACCGIELMATASSRYDLARFGAEVFRFSPRQADLMIVAGRVSVKMMPVLQRIYLQMTEPKWVISMGACASTGGEYSILTQSSKESINSCQSIFMFRVVPQGRKCSSKVSWLFKRLSTKTIFLTTGMATECHWK